MEFTDEKVIEASSTPEKTNEEVAEAITTALTTTSDLNKEAVEILNQLITEQDANKQKDLTYLFNQNQNKKTMVRVNKMSDLLDAITEQAMARITQRPDELSNKEMFDAMKTISDLIDKGQKQVLGTEQEAPFLQINQQNNEINMDQSGGLNRESRDRVKNAVLSLLNEISKGNVVEDKNVIEAEEVNHD